jgi:hypothetical protein
MQTTYSKLAGTLGALVLALMVVPNSTAQCGSLRQPLPTHTSWHPQYGNAHLMKAAFTRERPDGDEDTQAIVGLWHVTFTAEGNAAGPPDGTPIDNAIVAWHSDKTEIMNSGRPPQDGNFCMGVWEVTGRGRHNSITSPWATTPPTRRMGSGIPLARLTSLKRSL